ALDCVLQAIPYLHVPLFIDGSRLRTELADFLEQFVESGRISRWHIPDDFLMVDTIPKTSVGKLDKKTIRDRLSSNG
ncbi:hypothetical protein ACFL2Q_01210, partial [Thermodesulfobacteriota bacterium]